jgi:hypothetical protein
MSTGACACAVDDVLPRSASSRKQQRASTATRATAQKRGLALCLAARPALMVHPRAGDGHAAVWTAEARVALPLLAAQAAGRTVGRTPRAASFTVPQVARPARRAADRDRRRDQTHRSSSRCRLSPATACRRAGQRPVPGGRVAHGPPPRSWSAPPPTTPGPGQQSIHRCNIGINERTDARASARRHLTRTTSAERELGRRTSASAQRRRFQPRPLSPARRHGPHYSTSRATTGRRALRPRRRAQARTACLSVCASGRRARREQAAAAAGM